MPDLDRHLGCLLGLAAGDALGTTLEFRSPGSFEPIDDMVGGGPFHLEPGQWTDDTSMALCLAESIVETERFDPVDQLQRYCRWWREGHLSSTGDCFDIGNTVGDALRRFERTGEPYCGSDHEYSAGNGSIMRLAPVPLAWHHDPEAAIRLSGESSRTTHRHPAAINGCRYLAALLVGALQDRSKSELLSDRFTPVPGLWDREPLVPRIDAIAGESFADTDPPDIRGTGYVVRSLEAALWAFHRADDFRTGCLLAANLGDDADTTAAVYGQLAGAYWGEGGIPDEWLEKAALRSLIEELADRLLEFSHSHSRRGRPRDPNPQPDQMAKDEFEQRHRKVYETPNLPAFWIRELEGGLFYGRNPLTAKDVESLIARGVTRVLDLREDHEWNRPDRYGRDAVAALEQCGITREPVPIKDTTAPSLEQLGRTWEILSNALAEGDTVFVHCRGGVERTGTVIAAFLARRDSLSLDEILRRLAQSRLRPLPHQIEAARRWLAIQT